jgi:hypothetical protein
MSDRSIFIRTALVAAAGAVLVSAAPAMASKKGSSSPDAATTQSADQSNRKYCLSETVTGAPTVTGSILPKRQCLTKDQWAAKGVTFQTK